MSAMLMMKRSKKLSSSGWRDRQKVSILVELTVCQKNVANALNSERIVLNAPRNYVVSKGTTRPTMLQQFTFPYD